MGARAIAYGEERSIRFSRPVCSEQVSASETLPILPGWNNPALELLICDCPAVLRLLRGEDLEILSRALGVTAATLSGWQDTFVAAGEASLATRSTDGEALETERLK